MEVHAVGIFLHNLQPGHLIIIKLAFHNAFNSIRRDKMLLVVKGRAPAIYPFVHSAYSRPSCLFSGSKTLQSSEGIQQGDPLGPFRFCLALHDIVQEVHLAFLPE